MKKSIEFVSKDGKHQFVICVDSVTIHQLKSDDGVIYEALVTNDESIAIDAATYERIRMVKLGLL